MEGGQGREVFAVPGEAGASRSRGTHRLIRQGAKLVESVQDIVEEIAPQLLGRIGAVAGALERPAPVGAPIIYKNDFEGWDLPRESLEGLGRQRVEVITLIIDRDDDGETEGGRSHTGVI